MTTLDILKKTRAARSSLAALDETAKNRILLAMAEALMAAEDDILAENAADMAAARGHINDVMLDRLRLDHDRLAGMAEGVRAIAALPDHTGRVLSEVHRPNGLVVRKVQVPLGLVSIIYESRPNVTSDAAALAVKSGNVCVLRSGREAHRSACAIVKALNAYIASGIRCCHESTRAEDVLEKMRHGMYALMRYGSAWHDMPVIIKAVLDNRIDDRFACLISDDTHPDTLINEGHLDHIVRCAVKEGLDPIKAIQYVTINVATCFRMDHEMGSITPGKCADIVFFDDLQDIRITRTMIDGDVVAENGQMCVEIGPANFPEHVFHTMHVGHPITAESFRIAAPAGAGKTVRTRVIEIIPNRVGNYERLLDLPVKDGFVEPDAGQDVMKMVVFERHHETGTKGVGFLKGFGFKKGAMAQTVSHDAHNLLVAGTNDADMALAANTLVECGGGMCAVADGKVLAVVPLPIAGLMNDLPVREMAELVAKLDAAWKQMGCVINSPYMTMALVPLACLPELRLTNRGLVDCRTFRFLDLIEK